jgi:transposase
MLPHGNCGVLLVEIEKPENQTLAAWFSELRTWLDASHCTPLAFVPSGRRIDRLIYRISFDDAVQANKFSEAFARYLPTVRRATPFERDQLRAMKGATTRAGAPGAAD